MRYPLAVPLLAVLLCMMPHVVAQPQADPSPGTPTETPGEPATDDQPAPPASPDDAEQPATDPLERKALDDMMGGSRGPSEGPQAPTSEEPEPEPAPDPTEPAVDDGSRAAEEEGPADPAVTISPPGTEVPEVPEPPDVPQTEESPYGEDAYPRDDYATPGSDDADAQPGDQTDPLGRPDPQPEVPAPSTSPASAIIIGLIVLAVLLVALAAVVGIMAAQRQRPRPAARSAVPGGWAYLSAPGAPDISLQRSPFTMGSSPSCALRLADPQASPQHAQIDRTEDGYVLTDLESVNGTFLNGERIASPVALRSGDEIKMGDITVVFELYE